jgi:hypothetical protein
VLDKLKPRAPNNFSDIGVSHAREHKDTTKRGNNSCILRAARADRAYLVRHSGVKDRKVASDATLHEFLIDDVSRGNPHLRAARTGVVNLDGNAGSAHDGTTKLHSGERMAWHICHDFFDNLKHFVWLGGKRFARASRERQGRQKNKSRAEAER